MTHWQEQKKFGENVFIVKRSLRRCPCSLFVLRVKGLASFKELRGIITLHREKKAISLNVSVARTRKLVELQQGLRGEDFRSGHQDKVS